jgi:poly-gamma-glutamate capsule biosynthesis protein CapA/YwtB (metallophosphatase superfamily)
VGGTASVGSMAMSRPARMRNLALALALAAGLIVPAASPQPAAAADPDPVLVPLVPVTGFWSSERSIGRATLASVLAGAVPRTVYVSASDLPALAASLGVVPGSNVRRMTPADVRAAVVSNPGALGIVRAEDVLPKVRALAVDGIELFGTARLRALDAWPLLVAEPPEAAPSAFDPASAWTLVAGGDVNLERSVYRKAVLDGKGAGYPWNGGRAKVVDRYCCGWPGMRIMRARTIDGTRGAVRSLISSADIAIANLEGPAPDDFTFHPHGLVFTMDPDLLPGLVRAGFDAVSLANNHIRNDGASGVRQTVANLNDVGLKHFGAGKDLASARRPAWFTAAGQRVAILGYNGIGPAPNATSGSAGAAPLSERVMRSDIRSARLAGADVVIVVPHWGAEYIDGTTAQQRSFARIAFDAGADMILGNHSHWAGPVNVRSGGHLVVWSMGDLLFDLNHDERTQEAFVVEATFVGPVLAQVALRPTVVVDRSQLNLLTPAGGGTRLLRQVQQASQRLGAP